MMDGKIKETHSLSYSKEETEKVFKLAYSALLSKIIVTAVILALMFLFTSAIDRDTFLGGIFVFALIFLLLELRDIKAYTAGKKAWKAVAERIGESTYEYEIYEDSFKVSVLRGGEETSMTKALFSEIAAEDYGEYILFNCRGQLFIVGKDRLEEDSVFAKVLKERTVRVHKKKDKWYTTGIVMFIASIASVFGALLCVGVVSARNGMFTENMWIFFLFVPIPIASIILGANLNSRGYRAKKNVIAGVIMTVILCIYGCFAFIFESQYIHDDSYITDVEAYTEIDIPSHRQINIQKWDEGFATSLREDIYSDAEIYFTEANDALLEERIKEDGRWLSEVPSDLMGIMCAFYDYQQWDYVLMYNTRSGEYNSLPKESGSYDFVNIMYSAEDNKLEVVEYRIKYVS